MSDEKLKILFVASEMAPYAKSGGLADVAGSLPKALHDIGVDVRVVFPRYRGINDKNETISHEATFNVRLDWRERPAELYRIKADYPIYMIGNDQYFDRAGFYGHGDDFERFAFFSRAALDLLNTINFQADVVHFNDWQTALGCVYLKDIYKNFAFYDKTKSLYTIHNIQYQGQFAREILGSVGLNDGYFVEDKLEFYGSVSYMKAGLTYSDFISTVSETYSREIQTPQYSYGLDGMLRSRNHQLAGIVNGIDFEANNPATDKRIFANYSANNMDGKAKNKAELQKMLGLDVNAKAPMFAIISRLAEQKGLGLVAGVLGELVRRDVQIVILGTGEGHLEHMFSDMASIHRSKISTNITFDSELAQKIYAASDFFLMPSLFEPCGLAQLFAMRYGSLPIARKTGGLNDTVAHYSPQTRLGCGFLFEDFLESGLMWCIDQALGIYSRPDHMRQARKNAMNADFSWTKSAERYVELYKNLKHS